MCAPRNLDAGRVGQRRHFDLTPKYQRWVTDRNFTQQVVALALEERMLADLHNHIEIA